MDDLRAFHATYYRPDQSTLIVVGDLTPASALPLLEKHYSSWKPAGTGAKVTPVPAATQLTKRQIHIVDKPGAAQSQIRIGWVGTLFDSRLRHPAGAEHDSRRRVHVAAEHQSGETHGYSHGAFSGFEERISPGAFSARAGDKPTRRRRRSRSSSTSSPASWKPIPGEELDKAKNYVALGFPAEFESTGDLASKMEEQFVHGLPDEYFPSYVRAILQVAGPGVEQAATSRSCAHKFAVVVVGDRKVIEQGIERSTWVR